MLVDSSKFDNRSSLVLCPLARIDTVITDDGISDKAAAMLEAADVTLIVAPVGRRSQQERRRPPDSRSDCKHAHREEPT